MTVQAASAPELIWPSPHEVAMVIVEAARSLDEDPIKVATGSRSRARAYACIAPGWRFPDLTRVSISRMTGDHRYGGSITVARNAVLGRNTSWFVIERLNCINAACGYPAMTLAEAQDATLSAETRAFRAAALSDAGTPPENAIEAAPVAEIAPKMQLKALAEAIDLPAFIEVKASEALSFTPARTAEAIAEGRPTPTVRAYPPKAEGIAPPPWREISDDDLIGDGDHRPALGTFTPPEGAAAAVANLKNNECRWPIGEPSSVSFAFCCEPAPPGREPRYCDRHFKLHPSK